MKIFIVTDIHGEPDYVYNYLDNNPVDAIIVTGDITDFGPDDLFVEILEKLGEYAQVYAIYGNCDPEDAITLLDDSNAINIHDGTSNIENIKLVGFGGSNATPFNTNHEYSEEILYKELIKYEDELNSDNYTILVTHAPPLDTEADIMQSGEHIGSSAVRKVVEETQPTLNICGHIHESKGIGKVNDTVVVNPGDARSGTACLLDITDEDIENKNVKLELLELGE